MARLSCEECVNANYPADRGICAACQEMWNEDGSRKPFFSLAPVSGCRFQLRDPALIYVETVEAIVAEVRLKDYSVVWRAACDEVMDQIRARLAAYEEG